MDPLWKLHDKLFYKNRSIIWYTLMLTKDEIDERMIRVCQDGVCSCGIRNGDHPHSKRAFRLTRMYLVELCDGKLGKL